MANKSKVVHVAIEPEHYKGLKKLAENWACSISWVIRQAIKDTLLQELAMSEKHRKAVEESRL